VELLTAGRAPELIAPFSPGRFATGVAAAGDVKSGGRA